MTDSLVFPLTSGAGFGAVVHGNFVTVTTDETGFSGHVQAFQNDSNSQYGRFQSVTEVVGWAVAAAAAHQGASNRVAQFEHWEIRGGYSIAVRPDASGRFKSDIFPMWADSKHYPFMAYPDAFPTLEEAIQFARATVDQLLDQDADHGKRLGQIREALERVSG